MIERRIIIGLITSTEFIQRIQNKWNVKLFESATARRLAIWCMEYYDKYQKAPNREIENIFYQKLKGNLPKELAKEIEEEILPSLSVEYEEEGLNVDYLVDRTVTYFNERHLLKHSEEVQILVQSDKLIEAERLASSYKPITNDSGAWIDFSNESVLGAIEKAFNRLTEPLIRFPGALGEFLNDQLIRGGFVAFMGKSKMGKSFLALEFLIRGSKQKRKIALFQAGDMSDNEQIVRASIYLKKNSNKKKYCGIMYEPIKDCIFNQNDECNKEERECGFGIFPKKDYKQIRYEITLKELIDAYHKNKDYVACYNCSDCRINRWGTPWIKQIDIKNPLTFQEAQNAFKEFFIKRKRSCKLSTHVNNTLSVKQIDSILEIWERQEGFVPDIIITDYADLMIDEFIKNDERAKQNTIWKDLRGISQKRHCLVITFTQSDADSYTQNTLRMNNFSEDKRKYDHVTAMFGLNEDSKGREKEIGIMRINEMVKREGDFSNKNQVYILKNLKRGRPFLTSYW